MISIANATSEPDRLEASLQVVREVYENAVHTTAQYAIELDPTEGSAFRQCLDGIQERIPRGDSADEWRRTQASFRGELRLYHHKSMERIARFQAEIRSAAATMHSFAESVAAAGNGQEKEIRHSLDELDRIPRTESIEEIHGIVSGARHAIAGNLENITQRYQLMIAELRDEVGALHRQIEAERRAATIDASTGIWNRVKLESHVSELLATTRPFCLLLIHIRNLNRPEVRHPHDVLEASIRALLERVFNIVGETPRVGRWTDDSIASVLLIDGKAAMDISREIEGRLSGLYSIQDNGIALVVQLDVTAGIIDRALGSDERSFHNKLLHMSEALGVA